MICFGVDRGRGGGEEVCVGVGVGMCGCVCVWVWLCVAGEAGRDGRGRLRFNGASYIQATLSFQLLRSSSCNTLVYPVTLYRCI